MVERLAQDLEEALNSGNYGEAVGIIQVLRENIATIKIEAKSINVIEAKPDPIQRPRQNRGQYNQRYDDRGLENIGNTNRLGLRNERDNEYVQFANNSLIANSYEYEDFQTVQESKLDDNEPSIYEQLIGFGIGEERAKTAARQSSSIEAALNFLYK